MKRLTKKTIKSQDKSDMLRLLLEFPNQILDAAQIGEREDFSIKGDFNKAVFSGLGGSAIGADLIRSYICQECKIPIIVNRDYTLPAFVDENTILIVSSYSGNTEETLSAYKEGLVRRAKIVTITSNGEIKKMAAKDGFPCILIPQGLPPRCALGYSSVPIISLFSKLGLISNKRTQIDEAVEVLTGLRDEVLSPEVKDDKNLAKKIANALFNRYAVIYSANQHIDSALTRWRGQLAENAKTISSTHLFPEMNHNEIVGWANPKVLMKKFVVIMLRDEGDHPQVKKRMDISRSIIQKEGVRVIEVFSQGRSLLSRIFSLVYIGDFVSFYLAVLNNVDPTPVDRIAYLKKELAKT